MIEIVLDIETIPNQNLKEFHQEIINRKCETFETNKYCSITPEFSQIICIGLNIKHQLTKIELLKLKEYDLDIEENNIMFTGINETEIIINMYKYISSFKQSDIKIITFNGKKFDIPTILKRACLLNILPTYKFINKKYDMIYHYDIMEVLNNFYYDKNTLKLQEYAKIYGIENNDISDGSEVYKLFKENKLSEIEKHCIEDINTTRKLYDKIKGYF